MFFLHSLNEIMEMDYNDNPLISAVEARALLDHPGVVWVDARGGPDALSRYHEGHVPGAVFMDLEKDLSARREDAANGGRHPLPDAAAFGETLGKAGIAAESRVLVYDDKAGANAAARLWWMLRAVGHKNAQVVDGGWSALRSVGVPAATNLPQRTALPPFPTHDWALPLANMQAVEEARKASDQLVMDVRENYRYRGEREPIDLVAGHIPGAVNLPYLENIDENEKFLSRKTLLETFNNLIGKRDPSRVIVHCGSGVTACHTILAMAYAGLPMPRLYVGSWSEWSRNPNPIAADSKA